MARKAVKEPQVFYVGIDDAPNIRREVLMAAKQTLKLLQKSEHFKHLRKAKQEILVDLRKKVKEIYTLNSKVMSSLPVKEIRARKAEEEPPPQKVVVYPSKAKKHPQPAVQSQETPRMTQIESELEEIENQLRGIG